MSDVKVIRKLLTDNAPLVAAVPLASIVAGKVPQGTPLPALGILHVSTVRRQDIASSGAEFCTSRVQVTVMAANYVSQKQIAALVRAALPRSRGTIAGVAVDSVVKEFEGPDFGDDAAGICMQSLDYIVRYNE